MVREGYNRLLMVQKLCRRPKHRAACDGSPAGARQAQENAPDVVKALDRLYRKSLKTVKWISLRSISQFLTKRGFQSCSGNPYGPERVKLRLGG